MRIFVKTLLTVLILAAAAGTYWWFYVRPVPNAATGPGMAGPPAGFALPV